MTQVGGCAEDGTVMGSKDGKEYGGRKGGIGWK